MYKILMIEDDQEQMFLFQTVLEMRGLVIKVASTAAEVATALTADKPDLILSDIMLKGGENGLDILEGLQADGLLVGVPIFVFTNTNKKEYRDRAEALGVADYIIKSETLPQDLAEKIKIFLGAK